MTLPAARKGKGHNGRDRGRGRWYRLGFARTLANLRLARQGRPAVIQARPVPQTAMTHGEDAKRQVPAKRIPDQGACPCFHPATGVQCGYPAGHGGKRHYRRLGSHRISWPVEPDKEAR